MLTSVQNRRVRVRDDPVSARGRGQVLDLRECERIRVEMDRVHRGPKSADRETVNFARSCGGERSDEDAEDRLHVEQPDVGLGQG